MPVRVRLRATGQLESVARLSRRQTFKLRDRAAARKTQPRRPTPGSRPGCKRPRTCRAGRRPRYLESLDCYLDQARDDRQRLSCFFPGQRRDPGPDDGVSSAATPRARLLPITTTIALGVGGRRTATSNSAYQVCDLDALAGRAGVLERRLATKRSWGIGPTRPRPVQIFDYWRDAEGFMVEHFSDGDMVRLHAGTWLGAVQPGPGLAPVGAVGHQRTSSALTRDHCPTKRDR